jgi:hypothetical protein
LSIRVVPDQVIDHAGHRPFAYVVSTRDDASLQLRAHVIAVVVDINGAEVDCSRVGGSTRRNVATNSNVTLIWPPISRSNEYAGSNEYDSYTLIADGQASVRDETVVVTVSSAILHRPASD